MCYGPGWCMLKLRHLGYRFAVCIIDDTALKSRPTDATAINYHFQLAEIRGGITKCLSSPCMNGGQCSDLYVYAYEWILLSSVSQSTTQLHCQ